jgi:hypothetical protein
MTDFGNSRISVSTQGGGIGALNLNSTEKLLIFGRGDVQNGSVEPDDPTRVTGAGELESVFGDSRIADALRDAAGNGQSFDVTFGVVPEQVAETESISSGSGTLTDSDGDPASVIEDADLISIDSGESVVFRYEDPLDTSGLGADEVAINPDSGAFDGGDSSSYTVNYEYLEWADAFDSATGVIEPQEAGQWCVLSDSERVVSDAVTAISPLRTNQFKMVRLAAGAQPNDTEEPGVPRIDPGGYTDNVADEASFLFGPIREAVTRNRTALGAIGGAMASADLSESILAESLNGVGDLVQQMPIPVQEDLEDEDVISVSDFGSPTIEANQSTSSSERRQTFFTRRLADRLILAARAIARATRGDIANPNTAGQVENRLEDEIVELVDDGLLEPNTDSETNFFTSATADPADPKKLNVNFGFTPEGIVDTIEFSATINT